MGESVIGRNRELRVGERFLGSVPAGLSALVLEGEPGIGKRLGQGFGPPKHLRAVALRRRLGERG
jgi:hypothetical protein